MRWNRAISLAVVALGTWIAGCASDNSGTPSSGPSTVEASSAASSGSSSGSGGQGGAGGGGLCAMDCSQIQAPQCLVAVCNDGSHLGTVGACVVIPADKGTKCDDGEFCTVEDTCDGKGMCQGGNPNDCGMTPDPCTVVTCDENSQTCDLEPAEEGAGCTPTGLCVVAGVCQGGVCVGTPKDCSFSPDAECNSVACNPANGNCEPTPDAMKDGQPCAFTGDLCAVGKVCAAGQCAGGTPKDCSGLTVGCTLGVCDAVTGMCAGQPLNAGDPCTLGVTECHSGACDANGMCQISQLADGTSCNDHDACTDTDSCTAGVCAGVQSVGCSVYLSEGFEMCPAGWTFGGDWQCGTPTVVGPATAHNGTGCIGTVLNANYNLSQDYNIAVADSPPINLGNATAPQLSFWTWIWTEGSTYDGYNLKISTDNGVTFNEVLGVAPTYALTVNGQPAWGGDQSLLGWQNYTADLSSYAGQTVILRFSFRSDSSTNKPGVYIDDVIVGEAAAIPITITTTSPIADAFAGLSYAFKIRKLGGSPASVWSITGGVNNGWVSIDPVTGTLSGNPMLADVGPVTVNVHVQEPTLPGNFADAMFTFNVVDVGTPLYFESFEGACPNAWTLAGDWQCGTPTVVGPPTAFSGAQCLGTIMNANYNANDAWASTTATSPDIDLTAAVNPTLRVREWIWTEGFSYDGTNIKVSIDNGATYSIVNTVTPAYTLTVNAEACYGGDLSAQGWQAIQADLTPYIGHVVKLRFAMRTDGSGQYPGVYVDDVLVTDN